MIMGTQKRNMAPPTNYGESASPEPGDAEHCVCGFLSCFSGGNQGCVATLVRVGIVMQQRNQ